MEPTNGHLNEEKNEISLRELIDIVVRRKLVIAIVTAVVLLVGVLFALRPKKYAAEGDIRVQPGSSNMYRTSSSGLTGFNGLDPIASDMRIMQSRTLYLKVAKELNLENDKVFWDKKDLPQQSLDNSIVRDKLYFLMRKKISVSRAPKEEVLTITCTTTSPELSAKVVNTLINDYFAYIFQMRYGATQRASGWLVAQLSDLKDQVAEDQRNLVALQAKLGVISNTDKGSTYLFDESLSSIAKASSEATIDRIVAEAKYRYLSEADPNLIEGEVGILTPNQQPNGLLQGLRNLQASVATNYSNLRSRFGEKYPEVKQEKARLDEITKQVKQEETRIINQARLSYDAAAANENMTTKALQSKKTEAFSSRDDMVKYTILLHDYESHRNLYQGLMARLREAGITSGMEAGEIDVVNLADLPGIPVPPGRLMIMALSLLIGLALGILSTFVVEAFDSRIRTREEAERATGFTLLGAVPHFSGAINEVKQSGAAPLLVMAAPRSRYTEELQNVRSSLLLSRAGEPPKVIVMTSAVSGEGKSTTAMNLAAVFAQHQARVLLVDCDLRRGRLAERLGLDQRKGLSGILSGQIDLDEAIQQIPDASTLSILCGGLQPPNPAVLMDSPVMSELIQACRSRFDFIILDGTPVLGLSDAINIARLADATVMVVRENYSDKRAVVEAKKTMQQARLHVAGLVVNDVRGEGRRYYGDNAYYDDSLEKKKR